MRLKQVTTGLVIFGFLMLLGLPFLMGTNPQVDTSRPIITVKDPEGNERQVRRATRPEMAQYGVRLGVYILCMFGVWIAVIICAMLMIRGVRKEVSVMSEEHMKAFVEGTLADHARLQEGRKGDERGNDGEV